MSVNKLLVPGFGIGTAFGTPTTIALAETSTLSITSSLVGQFVFAGAAGVQVTQVSLSNGVTGTWTIANWGGPVLLDGISARLVNTTTSVNVAFISL